MRALALLSFVHALTAALSIEALLLLWRVDAPGERLRFRLLALAVPLLVTPALSLAPVRATAAFRDGAALFATAEWEQLRAFGTSAATVLALLAALSGLALYLPDLAAAFRRGPRPLLSAEGLVRPRVNVSAAAPALLEGERLRAALAHEEAHVARHDPRLSWGLLAVRTLLAFNPVAQVVARAALQEVERRADDDAAAAVGSRSAVAEALLALSNGSRGARAVELRVRRLGRTAHAPAPPWLAAARLAVAGGGLAALLFFVV